MRTFKLIAVAALAASTAACVETVDQGYGYSDGYYAPTYAAQPAYYGSSYGSTYYAPSYYAPTQVVTQTRYVPVPTPVPVRDANRSNDHRGDANRGDQHHDRPQAQNTPHPAPTPPAANNGGNNQHHGNGGTANSRDRDGDGRPDRRS
jgi:hypothetical protein